MAIFQSIIHWVFLITGWLALGYAAYFVFLSFFSIWPLKRKYPIVEDKNKFCIFIPCHNEEDVIAATVENISKIQYDASLVDFYIIADNCTDKTAANANKMIADLGLSNFKVFERNVTDAKKKGKPHALRWGIEKLEAENRFYNYYDMFMILDADNFADASILREINSQYEHAPAKKKPCMIQCYLDSKNADNIVAKGYSYGYRIFCNRAHQLSKSRAGLNATIGGTGFAMTMDFLKSINGFENFKSLTEDLEVQTMANIRGLRIYYNPHAHVYDEKPTGIRQSFVQKTRWSQGHWFVCFRYGIFLIASIFKARSIRSFFSKLDNFIYLHAFAFLLSWFFNILTVIISFIFGFSLPKLVDFGPNDAIPMLVVGIVLFIYSAIIYPYIVIKQDGTEREKRYTLIKLPYVHLCLFISTLVYTLSTMKGLLFCSRQGKWAKTKHIQTKISHTEVVEKEPEPETVSVE